MLNKVYNIFYKKKNQIKWYFSKHNLKLSRMLPFLGCFKNHSSCSPHHSCWMLHGQVPVTIIKLIQTNISYEIIKKLGKSFQSEIFGKIHDFWKYMIFWKIHEFCRIHDFWENTWFFGKVHVIWEKYFTFLENVFNGFPKLWVVCGILR